MMATLSFMPAWHLGALTRAILLIFSVTWAFDVTSVNADSLLNNTYDLAFTNNAGTTNGTVTGQIVVPAGTNDSGEPATSVSISPTSPLPAPAGNLLTNPAVTVPSAFSANAFTVSSSGNLGFCYGCGFNASWGYGGLQLSSNGTELSNNNQSVYAVGYAGIGYPQFIPASDNNIESIVQYSGGLQVTPKTTLQGNPPALFPTAISITFQPNYGLTLANAAALLGFT